MGKKKEEINRDVERISLYIAAAVVLFLVLGTIAVAFALILVGLGVF